MQNTIEQQLAALNTMSLAELRSKWLTISSSPVPRVSAGLLRLAIGWKMQADVYGGLSRRTRQLLDQLAAGKNQTRLTQPGMKLVREWDGKLHVVRIGADNAIEWNGRTWSSLSAVARAITGTRWSGPAFFGLTKKVKAA